MAEFDMVKLAGGGKPVLLAVLAHPDDETFGTGGTLAMYARRGVAVYLVCATRGEVGDAPAELLKNYSSVAELREAELRCASGLLQLSGIYFLDYRDSGMPGSPDNQHPQALAAAPEGEVAAKVVHYIRLLRPQVVITFDPIGGYHHPDHIAIQKAATRAFYEAADPAIAPDDLPAYQPQKLYYSTISKRMLRIAVRVMPLFGRDPHKFGRNGDIDLASIAAVNFPTQASIDYAPVAEIRAQAAACHSSQGGTSMARGVQGWIMRLAGQHENFMRAYPEVMKRKIERDLFEGVQSV